MVYRKGEVTKCQVLRGRTLSVSPRLGQQRHSQTMSALGPEAEAGRQIIRADCSSEGVVLRRQQTEIRRRSIHHTIADDRLWGTSAGQFQFAD